MNREKIQGWPERIYGWTLGLYPTDFRDAYATGMRQVFRDALADHAAEPIRFYFLIARDLVISLAKEYLAMARSGFQSPILLFNAVVLAGISSVLALALYMIPQQVLRQGLNDPQIQLAGDLVAQLEQGAAAANAVPAKQVDMARSLAPFVIVYDEQGSPVASQAVLNGAVPAPPIGVFDFVRQHGEERVSWQPVRGSGSQEGVRIAAVVQRVNGAHPGFVLAGRNMREVEARESQVAHMSLLVWLGMLSLIVVGTLALGMSMRSKDGGMHARPVAPAKG